MACSFSVMLSLLVMAESVSKVQHPNELAVIMVVHGASSVLTEQATRVIGAQQGPYGAARGALAPRANNI